MSQRCELIHHSQTLHLHLCQSFLMRNLSYRNEVGQKTEARPNIPSFSFPRGRDEKAGRNQ